MALKRKKWKGNEKCIVCNVPETVDHIFFICPLAKFAWICIKEALGWDRAPNSLQDFLEHWVPTRCRQHDLKITVLATVAWALWNARNKMAIEEVFIRSPTDIIFRINFFLQRWKVLLRGDARAELETWELQVRTWVEGFLEKIKDRPPDQYFF